jgi:hypothetical protein
MTPNKQINFDKSDYYHPYISNKIVQLEKQQRIYKHEPTLCYESKGSGICLNCKVTAFSNETNYSSASLQNYYSKVSCRHLSFAYLTTKQKKSEFLTSINSAEKIANHPDFLIDQYKLYKAKHANLAYYFSLDQLPKVIKKLITEQAIQKNQNEIKFLLLSSDHAMALTIKRKANNIFVIYFYDPNKTDIHRKTVLNDIKQLSNVETGNIIGNGTIDVYFQEKTPTACILSTTTMEDYQKADVQVFGILSPALSYLFLINGHIMFTKIADSIESYYDKNPLEDKVNFYQAQSLTHRPGLHIAFMKDHADSIISFCNQILNSNFNSEVNYNLLEAQCPFFKISGLHIAFISNNVNSIKAFVELILTSNLDYADKIKLLQAKSDNNESGLYRALDDNNLEAVEVFCPVILNSKIINDNDKIAILFDSKITAKLATNDTKNASFIKFKIIIENSIFQCLLNENVNCCVYVKQPLTTSSH